jgi:hypothetical protein
MPFFLGFEAFFDIAIAACCANFLGIAFLVGAFLAVFLPMQPQVMHIIQHPLLGQHRNRNLLRHILHRNLLHQEGQCQGQILPGNLRLP